VRDVARAHVRALITPQAAGERFLLCGHNCMLSECAGILARRFGRGGGGTEATAAAAETSGKEEEEEEGEEANMDTSRGDGYQVVTRPVSYWRLRLVVAILRAIKPRGVDTLAASFLLRGWERPHALGKVSSAKAARCLGIEPTPLERCLVDSAEALIRYGRLHPKRRAPSLRSSPLQAIGAALVVAWALYV
jgi:nucleoside-diphosphate-sugar epimerase